MAGNKRGNGRDCQMTRITLKSAKETRPARRVVSRLLDIMIDMALNVPLMTLRRDVVHHGDNKLDSLTGGKEVGQRSVPKRRLTLQTETTMSNHHFPPELLDYIVDLLRDSQGVLGNCCLVSKSWIPRTRRHLFENIRFDTGKREQSWKEMFQILQHLLPNTPNL